MAVYKLRYLHRNEIDTERWDHCIQSSPNGLIYARSFYLDQMARHWDALVWEDYKAVMPITWNRKYGFSYLYQPFCTAQLGVFSPIKIDEEMVCAFIDQLPRRFRYIDIDLNQGNPLQGPFSRQRNNYLLPLTATYNQLQQQYNRHARRKLRKAGEAGLVIREGIDIYQIIALSMQMMEGRSRVVPDYYERFAQLYLSAGPHVEACNTIAAVDPEGRIVSSDVYFVHQQRIYSLLAGNTPLSNEHGAFYFVLDHLIQRYAGSGYLLDFEGSDVPGIAFLFQCLGGQHTTYPHLRVNKLPWPLRLLKPS